MNKLFFTIILQAFVISFASEKISAQTRSPLFFREDWKESAAEVPVTQAHVANPDLILNLHGPAKNKIKKSNHPHIPNDPYYIWSGECKENWAVSLKHKSKFVDLSEPTASIKWQARQSGFRQLRIILKLADGTWLVSDQFDEASNDWREREFKIADIRWRTLNINHIIEENWIEKPDLSRVDEIGFTDLMNGGQSKASSRLDWIEVYGKAVDRK